ncbi:MAG TPA: hypothetical protein VHO24_20050 [Opitutaceae bacterium]|nr:hypothetical protein [Opitutaceae bacterium]
MPQLATVVILSIVAGILSLCAMAIIRGSGKKVVGYRPTWLTGLGACYLGYWISLVFGGIWGRFHPVVTATDHFLHVFSIYGASFLIFALLHMGISLNGGGHKPRFRQSLFLGGVQAGTGLVWGVAAWYLGQAVKAARTASL